MNDIDEILRNAPHDWPKPVTGDTVCAQCGLMAREALSTACSVVLARQLAEARAATDWRALAYAKLGVERDHMTPDEVVVVQRFLGPWELRGEVGGEHHEP